MIEIKYEDIQRANETIKTTDIKGKDYAEVNQRIKAFRMLYPQGFIIHHLTSNQNGICVFTAEVGYYIEHNTIAEDKEEKKYQDTYLEKVVLGVGTAYEKENSTFINKTSYIENCETSAVGRALGMAGFGIDVSVASAEEVQNAIQNQEPTKEEADEYKLTFGKYKDKTLKEIYEEDKKYIQWLLGNSNDERLHKIIELSIGIKIPDEEEQQERLSLITDILELAQEKDIDIEEIHSKFKINDLQEMTTEQMKKCITAMNKKGE